MAKDWTSVNFEKEYIEGKEKFIENRKEYNSVKQFLKEAANQKEQKIKEKENQQLINLLEKIIQETDTNKKEIMDVIKNQ